MQSSSCKYLVPILDFILIFDTQCSFLFDEQAEGEPCLKLEVYDEKGFGPKELMGVVRLKLTDFAPAITDEDFFPVESTDRCPSATGMCRVRLRVVPTLGSRTLAGGFGGGMRDGTGRMRKRRTSMFPSTAIKEGSLYVRIGGEWKSRHCVLTKEQLNFYEDSSSMKKLDQIHLLTPMGANDDPGDSSSGKKKSKNRNKEGRGNSPVRRDTMEGGSAAALGLNETKTCYLAITWDYENAQRSTPTEKVRENCFCRPQGSPFVNILASQVLSLSIYVISFCFSFRHFLCWAFPRDNNNAKTNAYH